MICSLIVELNVQYMNKYVPANIFRLWSGMANIWHETIEVFRYYETKMAHILVHSSLELFWKNKIIFIRRNVWARYPSKTDRSVQNNVEWEKNSPNFL